MPDLAEAFNILGTLTYLGKSKLRVNIATVNWHLHRKSQGSLFIIWKYLEMIEK